MQSDGAREILLPILNPRPRSHMPVIKVNDQQFSLNPGQTRLGGGIAADVSLGDESLGIQAIVDLGSDGRAVISRGSDHASVRVNGVALGVEPTPLLHGDKMEIAGRELQFADDNKGGATQFVSASEIAAMAQKRSGLARVTAATGGRLVSLVDGKEYAVPDGGVTFGRDAGCGIVVAQTEVSRLHAEINAAENGYVILDRSTNGLLVNGTRVQGPSYSSRADIIRIGTGEEFRFYADVVPVPADNARHPARLSALHCSRRGCDRGTGGSQGQRDAIGGAAGAGVASSIFSSSARSHAARRCTRRTCRTGARETRRIRARRPATPGHGRARHAPDSRRLRGGERRSHQRNQVPCALATHPCRPRRAQ